MHLADAFATMDLSPLNGASILRRKVCIYGAGLGKHEAPLDDPSWEVWSLNLVPPLDSRGRLRCDKWFDLHQRKAQTKDDLRWIAACPVPIYLPPDLMDASPRAIRFPLEEIEKALKSKYWAVSFAYQIALVMYENWKWADSVIDGAKATDLVVEDVCEKAMSNMPYTDLGLYGIELAWGTERERTVEWACASYWLGRAQQSGLRIHTPVKEQSLLGQHYARYGFEYQEEIDAVNLYVGKVDWEDDDRRESDDWKGDVGGR